MSDPAILKILRWAAGAPEDVSGLEVPDAEDLLALLGAHNLVTRFHYRAQNERPPWYTRRLSVPAWTQARVIEARVRRQVEAVREIAPALPPSAGPLLVIKGPATFAATGERHHLRFSSDLDLLCADNQCLWETLLRLGYSGERSDEVDETKASAHEFGVAHRGEVMVEVHDHFPVACYPDAVRDADLAPERHPGRWVQDLPVFRQSQIPFEALAAHAVHGTAPDLRHLRVPDPAASALVCCAHEFRNYLHAPFTGMAARLSALADVYDLAHDPRFDPSRFLTLTARTGCQDSVGFVAALLHAFYGRQPLPVAAPPFTGAAFPQSLSYAGGWAALTEPDDVLLMPGTEAVAARLGANRVVAPPGGEPRLYTTAPEGKTARVGAEPLPRLILNSPEIPRVELAARHDHDALHLHVSFLDRLPDGCEYEVYAQCRHRFGGVEAWDWKFLAGDRPGGPSPAYVQDLAFRWASVPEAFRQARRIPVMLAVGRFHRAQRLAAGWIGSDSVRPLAVIPLEVVCPP